MIKKCQHCRSWANGECWDCEEPTCENHSRPCSNCQEMNCDDCIKMCEECGSRFCQDCSSMCHRCRLWWCNKCSEIIELVECCPSCYHEVKRQWEIEKGQLFFEFASELQEAEHVSVVNKLHRDERARKRRNGNV